MKKFLSVFISILLIVSLLASCGNTETPVEDNSGQNAQTKSTGTEIKLAYSRSDSLNPFQTKTVINNQITGLVFEGLFSLDENYEPQPAIAKSVINGSTTVNVTINDVLFSNGTKVTVNDIISSFSLAKESEMYKGRLSNFVSAVMSSENMVMFTLEHPDPFAVSCLSFPIVKSESDEELPIGSGRYMYTKKDESVYLITNTRKADFTPKIKTIRLEAIHESSSVESSLVIGTTAFSCNDLSTGEYSRINAKSVDMGINSLVYIGFNSSSVFFSEAKMRKAITYTIDRDEIISSAFLSHARSAYSPFNPDFYYISSLDLSVKKSAETAKSLIKEAGFSVKERQITLLVCKDNPFKEQMGELVKEQLRDLGFSVNYKSYDEEAFLYDLQAGAYDLYIGEIKPGVNMDLSSLFGGSASYGIDTNGASAQRYSDFLNEKCELMDFLNTFNEDMPFVPVCYRNAVVSYTNSLTGDFTPCECDVFCDIDTWGLK